GSGYGGDGLPQGLDQELHPLAVEGDDRLVGPGFTDQAHGGAGDDTTLGERDDAGLAGRVEVALLVEFELGNPNVGFDVDGGPVDILDGALQVVHLVDDPLDGVGGYASGLHLLAETLLPVGACLVPEGEGGVDQVLLFSV